MGPDFPIPEREPEQLNLFKSLAKRLKYIESQQLLTTLEEDERKKLELEIVIIKALAKLLNESAHQSHEINLGQPAMDAVMEYISGAADANNNIDQTVKIIWDYILKQLN